MYAGYFVVDYFVGDDGDARFASEFLDEGLATGFVLYIEGAKSPASPLVVEGNGLGLEFGEVPAASDDVDDIDVTVAGDAHGHGDRVVGGLGLLEGRVEDNDDLGEVIVADVVWVVESPPRLLD